MFNLIMMESKKYLIEKLHEIHNRFRNLSIKYQYCFKSNMHIVEVLPLCEYKDNIKYLEIESDLTFEFDNKFFPEAVLFVSADSLTKVLEPEIELISENKVTRKTFEYSGFVCNDNFMLQNSSKIQNFRVISKEEGNTISFTKNSFNKEVGLDDSILYSLAA